MQGTARRALLVMAMGLIALVIPAEGTPSSMMACGTGCGTGVYAKCEDVYDRCNELCEGGSTGGICGENDDRCGGGAYYTCA